MSQPFIAELRIISWNFAPRGWAFCNGQLLPINQNQALFSLLGTTYGGDGRVNFALPNLQGRVPIHMGSGFTLGQAGGEVAHTLTQGELPQHNHFLQADATTVATSNSGTPAAGNALGQTIGQPPTGATFPVSLYTAGIANLTTLNPAVVGNTGGNQPHENRQPFLALNVIIALQGIFPSTN
jgi:microcystin-dependent protein